MSIITHAKEIGVLIKKYNDQDLYERIVTLREEILELRDDNIALREERDALKKAADVSSKLRRDGNCYFLDDDPEKERPYCLTCWDADRKLVSQMVYESGNVSCNICDARRK